MSLSDVRRRRGTAKGGITKATIKIKTQSTVVPSKRDLATLHQIKDSILKAEVAFEDTIDHSVDPEEDEVA